VHAARSLYARIVARLLLVLGVAGSALVVAAWVFARVAADEAYDRSLLAGALQIAENTWQRNGVTNVDVPVSAFYVMALHDRVFYKVLDPAGRVVAGDGALPATLDWPALRRGPLLQSGRFQDEPVRLALVARRMYDPEPDGWAVVVLAETLDARTALARSLTAKILGIIVVMGAITIGGAMLAMRQALAPLARVAEAIERRDPASLEPLEVDAPAEAAALVATINLFIARLRERIALMRRVIGDVAHQLRTPITAALGQVELLEHQTSESGRRQQMERVRRRLADMGTLTQQLIGHAMVLHRADAGAMATLDVAALVRQAMAELLSRADTRDIDASFDAPDAPLLVHGDAVTLREALRNVLDNALAHGARSRLEVRVAAAEQQVTIEVRDDGPGIAAERWSQVLQPFQPRDGGRDGASLGLAIVGEVMRAHRGSVHFAFDPDGDFVVGLRLPAAPDGGAGP